jgi:formylglycine-generating enzyme
MKNVVLTILFCVCAAMPIAAQVDPPEGMVLIPAGKFWMGRAHAFLQDSIDVVPRAKIDDIPANNIYLDAFYLDKYEVTNAEYARFLEATGGKPPWHWPHGKFPAGQERFPATNLNWFEATAYCTSVGKRLPTEAEWEKAMRAGLDRKHFPAEGALPPSVSNRTKPMPVGSFKPNAYGVYDMIGSVTEWTSDWYDADYYPFMPKVNPKGPEKGLYKSVRGTGWAEGAGGATGTTYYRNFTDPESRSLTIGVRCAK